MDENEISDVRVLEVKRKVKLYYNSKTDAKNASMRALLSEVQSNNLKDFLENFTRLL